MREEKTVWGLAAAGLTAAALSPYAAEHRPRPGLILGYAGFPEDEIRAAVERLARALAYGGEGP